VGKTAQWHDTAKPVHPQPDAPLPLHRYTYSGHPVACAVALRNLRVIEEEGLVEPTRATGAVLAFSPPLAITEAEVTRAVETVGRPIEKVAAELSPTR
jgi:adenosylmethionine-8-amino-7-oxononanoate aminotransferase